MSNLIALQNSSNTLGLGTSHIGLGTTGSSVLPFKKNDGTILMNFNTSNNSINLGTISSGVWQGSIIEPAYGGLGVTTLGLANQVLSVNSLGNYNWTNNEIDLTTTTEISTNVTSTIGIGSTSHDLTINTSKLTINIGNNTPQDGQILKYNNNGLIWSDSNSDSTDKLWTLIKNFHPGYVLFLKSIQLSGTNTINAISPTFDPIITDYSINVNDNLTVSITPNKFNIPSNTTEATTLINNSVIQDSYIILNSTPNSNIFTIKNSYTENSETFDKNYTLNVVRNKLTENNLDILTITDQNSNNITLNETLGVGTVYTIDVNTNVKNIKMTSKINRTVQRLGIGTVSGTDTPLNISKNNDSIIGIGTGFVGIGTTDVFDTNIESGRISDVFLNIKAENNSDKQYTFKISSPPRNNTELDQIIITKIKTDDTEESLSPIINSPALTEIDISNLYKEIKFEIKKKHLDQTISIEKDSTNSNSVGVNIDSSVGHTLITQLSTFSNYIKPQNSDTIVDNFKITNTAENQQDSITYQIKCTKIRSTSTTIESIKYKKNTQDLGISIINTNQDISEPSGIPSSVIIDVDRIGGQQVKFDVTNSLGIGTQHSSDTENFFNDSNINSNKTIYLDNTLSTFKIVLKILAENVDYYEIYNISINDLTAPTLTNITIVSDNTDTTKAIVDDTITLSFTASETLQADPIVTFSIGTTNDLSATVTNVSGNDYTATHIVQTGETGLVSYSISSYTDISGNNGNDILMTNSSITVYDPVIYIKIKLVNYNYYLSTYNQGNRDSGSYILGSSNTHTSLFLFNETITSTGAWSSTGGGGATQAPNTYIWKLTPQSNGNYILDNSMDGIWANFSLQEVELEFTNGDYNTLLTNGAVNAKIKLKSTTVNSWHNNTNGTNGFTASGYSGNSVNQYLIADGHASWGGPVYWNNMRTLPGYRWTADTFTLQHVT
tara:strand:+ start:3437 stop:6289 length:2853 start_codon:yes stop_codon:yes gene_type:complete